jgi:glycosyltransferase 2 family protein
MNRRLLIIQGVFSLVALAAVVWWASHQEAPTIPTSGSSIAWLAGGLALYALVTLMRGERWWRILRRQEVHVQRRDAYALTTVGYAGNNILPLRAGEALRVVILSRRTDAGIRTGVGTVLAERILDAITLGTIFVVVVLGLLRETSLPGDGHQLVFLAIGLGVVALLGVALIVMRRHHVVERARDWLRPIAGAPRALLSKQGAALLIFTCFLWVVEAGVYTAVAHAVSLDISLTGSMYLVVLTNLFALLPAAPGYVGTFDFAVIFGVKALGGASAVTQTYLILLRFILFVPITIVGFLFLVLRYGGLGQWRTARVEAEASRA